tara:strand:+ start:475 stop:1140 length:666 start_codon:yes stop_codon:yes gene_type:complete
MSFPNSNYNFTVVNEANLNSLVTNAAAVAGDLSVSGNLTAGSLFTQSLAGLNNQLTLTALAATPNQVINLSREGSGGIIIVNLDSGAAGNINIVLPAAEVGLNYTFIMRGAVAGAGGDIRIYPNGYTQAGGITAAVAPANTISLYLTDRTGATNQTLTQVSSAVGNALANGQGGVNFAGGVAVGPDRLYLQCVSAAAPTGVHDPQWTGKATCRATSALVAS